MTMHRYPWLKLKKDTKRNPKIIRLSLEHQAVFYNLLQHAGLQEEEGAFDLDDMEDLALEVAAGRMDALEGALEQLLKFKVLRRLPDGRVAFSSYQEHQASPKDTNAERQRRFYERHPHREETEREANGIAVSDGQFKQNLTPPVRDLTPPVRDLTPPVRSLTHPNGPLLKERELDRDREQDTGNTDVVVGEGSGEGGRPAATEHPSPRASTVSLNEHPVYGPVPAVTTLNADLDPPESGEDRFIDQLADILELDDDPKRRRALARLVSRYPSMTHMDLMDQAVDWAAKLGDARASPGTRYNSFANWLAREEKRRQEEIAEAAPPVPEPPKIIPLPKMDEGMRKIMRLRMEAGYYDYDHE